VIAFREKIGSLRPQQSAYMGLENNQMLDAKDAMTNDDKKRYISESIRNVYLMLHTEMMFNACISSKWACIWAVSAAIVAALGMIGTWITVLIMLFNK
jgi:hypothetical protein